MQGEYSYGVSGLVGPLPARTHEDQAVLDLRLLDRVVELTRRIILVFPHPAPREQRRGGAHRKALRVQVRPNLRPIQWHPNRPACLRPCRQHRDSGGQAIVAQIVEENFPAAIFLAIVVR